MVKNRGKGQNPGILIKFATTVRKKVTSRRSVSSYIIGEEIREQIRREIWEIW